MNIYLDDTKCREMLVPFTSTRHVADIRLGIFTIREKWHRLTGANIFTEKLSAPLDAIVVNANIVPTRRNINHIIDAVANKVALIDNDDIKILHHPWQIFQWNDYFLREDFELATNGRQSAPISNTNSVIGNPAHLFLEEGVSVECCTINTTTGPVYFGQGVTVMEGSNIRGPFAACEKVVIKMGAKIYGATSAGPACVLGGEIKNSVFFGHSNKAHDGYLGDSVIGAWCNLGAGTSNSNVKNTGGQVKYFLEDTTDYFYAGSKAGLLMGDYCRTAINTSFNTGTVVGACSNVFTPVQNMKHIPAFTWGTDKYHFEKAISDIENWKKMKGRTISQVEKDMLWKLYNTNI